MFHLSKSRTVCVITTCFCDSKFGQGVRRERAWDESLAKKNQAKQGTGQPKATKLIIHMISLILKS